MKHPVVQARVRKVLLFYALTCLLACSARNEWRPLLTKNISSNWDTYLGPSFDSLGNLANDPPPGLNHDPDNVFSVNA
jgi:hypothetical protein